MIRVAKWMNVVMAHRVLVRLGISLLVVVLISVSGKQAAGFQVADPPQMLYVGKLVLRDLSVVQVERECPCNADGIYLPDGRALAWWQILNATSTDESQATVDQWIDSVGRDWFLLKSRLERSESYGLEAIAERMHGYYVDQPDASSVAGAEFSRWMMERAVREGRLSEAVVALCNQRTPTMGSEAGDTAAMAAAYRLVAGRGRDAKTGIDWQVPPLSNSNAAEKFLQDSSEWEVGGGREAELTLTVYRLMAAASIGPKSLWDQWLSIENENAFPRSAWDSLLRALVESELDTEQIVRLVSEREANSSWGEKFLCYWLVGTTLLQREDRKDWMLGASYLLKIGFVQQHSKETAGRPPRSSETEWTKAAAELVADKFGEVGETGKMELLRRYLSALHIQ